MERFEELETVLEQVFGPYDLTPETVEAIRMLLDNRYEGLVVVDVDGRVVYMNRENERYLGLPRGGAKGRHVTELIPSSRLHVVSETGTVEVAQIQEIQGKLKVVSRVPIRAGDRVIGAVGTIMFRDLDEVHRLTRRIRVLEDRVAEYEKKLRTLPHRNRYTFEQILGRGRKLLAAVDFAKRIARSEADVLILGETGTGKELFAHAIHNASPRADGPFVRLNCAAIPRDLAESELFGYEPGSFSGAGRKGRAGKFEQAHGGTIFLDEIGDLSLEVQAKLLRVLQEKEVERVGSTALKVVDFRLIAASNVDLKDLCDQGKFRLDLYFRLNRMLLQVPPLREHAEDIPLYLRHFLETRFDYQGPEGMEVTEAAQEALVAYAWPGNVRELMNVIERAAWNVTGRHIQPEDLPSAILTATGPPSESSDGSNLLGEAVEEAEKRVIRRVLAMTGNNKNRAARLLGIHRTTLYQKLARYRIQAAEE